MLIQREYVCIVCPRSCKGEITIRDGIFAFSGYVCKRGETYTVTEYTSPKRMLTTTVTLAGARTRRLPVVSSEEISRDKVRACIEFLYTSTFQAPIKAGDTLVENILGTQVNIIAAMTFNSDD